MVFNCTQRVHSNLCIDNSYMVVVWLKYSKTWRFLVYLEKQQTAKPRVRRLKQQSKVVCQTATSKDVELYSRNSAHCFTNFTIQLIVFLHNVQLLLCFSLSDLLHPLSYCTQSVLQHIPELSMFAQFVSVFIAECISISKSLSYSLPFFSWHKKLQQSLIHVDDYKGVALW